MSIKLETLILDAFNRPTGWEKLFDEKTNTSFRALRIGSTISCNGDLLKDYSLKDRINNILTQKNIQFTINEIDTPIEFSYQVQVDDENYEQLQKQYN
jgi:hypothetical protein